MPLKGIGEDVAGIAIDLKKKAEERAEQAQNTTLQRENNVMQQVPGLLAPGTNTAAYSDPSGAYQHQLNLQYMGLANDYNTSAARESMAFTQRENAINRQFQQQSAQEAMDWQERMSNTAYQRAAKDMKAAGINPIYAVQGGGISGASAGGGHTAVGSAGGGTTASSAVPQLPSVSTSAQQLAAGAQAMQGLAAIEQLSINTYMSETDRMRLGLDLVKNSSGVINTLRNLADSAGGNPDFNNLMVDYYSRR